MNNNRNSKKLLTETTIESPGGQFKTQQYFMPSLAIEIGLREGVPLNTSLIRNLENELKHNERDGLWKWDESRPADYDDTLVARNVLYLLGKGINSTIPASISENGGLYTYSGGIEEKPNNSVDLVINARILDSISNLGMRTNKDKQVFEYVKSKKNDFYKPITEISKYYISEGFLIYVASKITEQIEINIDELVESKIDKLKGITDTAFALLANPKNKKLKAAYFNFQNTHEDLFLFQQPSQKYRFRNQFLEQIVNLAAKKAEKQNFDDTVANIYTTTGENVYSYEKHAKSLIELMSSLGISQNDKLTELAVGTGNFLKFMIKNYTNILGIDISPDMIKYAGQKADKARIELINAKDFSNNSKAIYSTNFIDLYSSNNVEIWSDNMEETHQILTNIAKNLTEKGTLFLHKKEEKKPNNELKHWYSQKGHKIQHIYLFQNSENTIRRTFNKITIPFNEFESKLSELNLKKIQENEHWIAYQKNHPK